MKRANLMSVHVVMEDADGITEGDGMFIYPDLHDPSTCPFTPMVGGLMRGMAKSLDHQADAEVSISITHSVLLNDQVDRAEEEIAKIRQQAKDAFRWVKATTTRIEIKRGGSDGKGT